MCESFQNSLDLYFPKSSAHLICFWNERMCLCVCVCVWLNETREKLIKEEKRKKFMFAYWHTCEKPCVICARVCQWLSLKSKEKRLISVRMLYSAGHTHPHKHIHNEPCLHSFKQRNEELLFVNFLRRVHTKPQTDAYCLCIPSLSINTILWWLSSAYWCPWTLAFLEVDLIF